MKKLLLLAMVLGLLSGCVSQNKVWIHPTNERYGEQWQKDLTYCEGHVPFAAAMGIAGIVGNAQSKKEMTRCLEGKGYYQK